MTIVAQRLVECLVAVPCMHVCITCKPVQSIHCRQNLSLAIQQQQLSGCVNVSLASVLIS